MPSKSIKKSLSKSIKKSLKYSRKKCPFGSISRIGYNYKKKSLNNRKIKVRSACIKSKGKRSYGVKPKRVLPTLKKGSLTKYGYHVSETTDNRHKALKKAFKEYGYSSLIKKLNAVRIYNKSRPAVYQKYTSDIKYVQTVL